MYCVLSHCLGIDDATGCILSSGFKFLTVTETVVCCTGVAWSLTVINHEPAVKLALLAPLNSSFAAGGVAAGGVVLVP